MLMNSNQSGNLNGDNGEGETPLSVTATMGDVQAVNLLYKSDAFDVDGENDDGNTALHMAASLGYVHMHGISLPLCAAIIKSYLPCFDADTKRF